MRAEFSIQSSLNIYVVLAKIGRELAHIKRRAFPRWI